MTMAIAMAARNALPSFSREEEFWQRRRKRRKRRRGGRGG